MIKVGNNIWIFEGAAVPFFTLPYSTRMTVVRLADDELWIHSPIALTDELIRQIDQLGTVKYLISPNPLHHLFIQAWQDRYPEALTFGTKALQQKRPEICFEGIFTPHFNAPWAEDIAQLLFTGSPAMEECVFFHKPSATLIVTDLIENFAPESFTPLKRWVASAAGILAPNGKMPLDWRLSFMFSKTKAKQHLQNILSWHPKKIVMAHGQIINSDAEHFLKRSFNWLNID
ncbi:DUF4336 domain-containing protein [uncultured Amphritea sp.]|uniref:DUF4336 domain-containing protein n=1 Tax=uncultured Amphritea sp. TaxID=981605 RepID=UPI00261C5836|nr:DUF4336 domain-containing protein [uncultured Amphritea sp.]